jgi:hypothetical protein
MVRVSNHENVPEGKTVNSKGAIVKITNDNHHADGEEKFENRWTTELSYRKPFRTHTGGRRLIFFRCFLTSVRCASDRQTNVFGLVTRGHGAPASCVCGSGGVFVFCSVLILLRNKRLEYLRLSRCSGGRSVVSRTTCPVKRLADGALRACGRLGFQLVIILQRRRIDNDLWDKSMERNTVLHRFAGGALEPHDPSNNEANTTPGSSPERSWLLS